MTATAALVAYEVTESGDRFRSVKALIADSYIKSEMTKTSEAFDIVTKRQKDEDAGSKNVHTEVQSAVE